MHAQLLHLFLAPLVLFADNAPSPKPGAGRGAAVATATASGFTFTNVKYGFSAVFPYDLKEEEKKDGEIMLAAGNPEDTIAYMLSIFTISDEVLKRKPVPKILDDAVGGAVENVKGTLVAKSDITIDGFPGKAFDIKSEQFMARCRIYLVGKRMYLPMVIFQPDLKLPIEPAAFHSSFKLINPPKH